MEGEESRLECHLYKGKVMVWGKGDEGTERNSVGLQVGYMTQLSYTIDHS